MDQDRRRGLCSLQGNFLVGKEFSLTDLGLLEEIVSLRKELFEDFVVLFLFERIHVFLGLLLEVVFEELPLIRELRLDFRLVVVLQVLSLFDCVDIFLHEVDQASDLLSLFEVLL